MQTNVLLNSCTEVRQGAPGCSEVKTLCCGRSSANTTLGREAELECFAQVYSLLEILDAEPNSILQ